MTETLLERGDGGRVDIEGGDEGVYYLSSIIYMALNDWPVCDV